MLTSSMRQNAVMVAALHSPTGASAALLKATRHDRLGVLISVAMIWSMRRS
jgi:hypothetical protein